MFASRYMPCPDCGASLEARDQEKHACDHERWLDFQLFHARGEIDLFATELTAYLASARGRFETWYAENRRDLSAA